MSPPQPGGKCELCGEDLPEGEKMFRYHGYSGLCPNAALRAPDTAMSEPNLALQGSIERMRLWVSGQVWLYPNEVTLIKPDAKHLLAEVERLSAAATAPSGHGFGRVGGHDFGCQKDTDHYGPCASTEPSVVTDEDVQRAIELFRDDRGILNHYHEAMRRVLDDYASRQGAPK